MYKTPSESAARLARQCSAVVLERAWPAPARRMSAGEQRVGHLGQELTGVPVRRDDGRPMAMALDHQLVEVVRLGDIERVKSEIIEQEQIDADQFGHLGFGTHRAGGAVLVEGLTPSDGIRG